MIFYWFSCPNKHEGLIFEEEKNNERTIVCEKCNFMGFAREGEVGEEYEISDPFAHLKG